MKILEAKAMNQFKVSVRFADGVSGLVDLGHLAGRGVFLAWLEDGGFEQVTVTSVGALKWPGGLDLCPDALYLQMVKKSPQEVFAKLNQTPAHA